MSGHDIDLENLTAQIFNPKTLLFSVADEFQTIIDSRGLELNYSVEGANDDVITFPDILRQIIVDLFTVMIGPMQKGSIEIMLESDLCNAGMLLLAIEDRSRVIAEERIPSFFSATVKPNLIRAKYLIKKLGGTLEIESDEEMGTAFIITIPVQYQSHTEASFVKAALQVDE